MIGLWKRVSKSYQWVFIMLLFISMIQLGSLIYIWKVESALLIEKEKKNLRYQLDNRKILLLEHMQTLQKELNFLAKLNVMDDVITKDFDKRVSILLQKKAKDLSEGIILIAIHNGKIVSSSQKKSKEIFLEMSSPIVASFNHKTIGKLLLLYPVSNFEHIVSNHLHQEFWMKKEHTKGKNLAIIDNKKIIVSTPLKNILHEYILYLSYEKEYALETINEIGNVLLWVFLISLLLLLFISWKIFKKQITIVEYTKEILEVKKVFLSTMSHELRTPLSSILNLTQHLMVSENVKSKEVDMLRHIESASEHLLLMINNLLQLSKLESNLMIVNNEIINIEETLEDIVEMLHPLIVDKKLQLIQSIEISQNEICTDKTYFMQVIMNLLSNAIKFTPEGSITISLSQNSIGYTVSIKDTGIGIEKHKQEALFLEYYTAHNEDTNIKYSSGLGLALSQKVAMLIEGKIEIISQGLERGTEAKFYFKSL